LVVIIFNVLLTIFGWLQSVLMDKAEYVSE